MAMKTGSCNHEHARMVNGGLICGVCKIPVKLHDPLAGAGLCAVCKTGWPLDQFCTRCEGKTMKCGKCGCLWRKNEDGSESLADANQKPGPCCDNASVRETTLTPLVDAAFRYAEGSRLPHGPQHDRAQLDFQAGATWAKDVVLGCLACSLWIGDKAFEHIAAEVKAALSGDTKT